MDDLRAKITHYARNDDARRSIARAARQLVLELHTWDARARFISKVAEGVLVGHAPRYTPPPEVSKLEASSRYVGCFDAPTGNQLRAHGLTCEINETFDESVFERLALASDDLPG